MDLLKEYDVSNLRHLYNKARWEVTTLRRQTKRNNYNQQTLFAQLRRAELAKLQIGLLIVDLYQHCLATKDNKIDMAVDTPAKVFDKYDVMVTLVPRKRGW
jgi:hypothetical protein